jgi:osmoprotectant transport system ATP-binding protein
LTEAGDTGSSGSDGRQGRGSSGAGIPRGASTVSYRKATKRYPGSDSDAVHELDLEVEAGEICVLVGPSGCGKTTAMRMANRTVEITSGDIEIDGASVRDRDPSELRREIGYVIQQIGLFPHRTVAENIATVPGLLGWDKDRADARVRELLELTGLGEELGERYPAQLSGGQQQRVGVARALAVDPPLMLMDEPFGAIDPINRTRLQNEFLRLQATIGKTVLFVTHDIDEAIKMGDRIAVLREGGHLAQYSNPLELLANPSDDFVRDFVGADRPLKRLSLIPMTEVSLWQAPVARAGEDAASYRARLGSEDVRYPILVDENDRVLGWLDPDATVTDTVPAAPDSIAEPLIEIDSTLRDGLSQLLERGVQFAPVIEGDGRLAGVLSIEIISEFLSTGEQASLPGSGAA